MINKVTRTFILIVISPLILLFIINPKIVLFLGKESIRGIPLQSRMDKIIYHTDHESLLTASRTLIKEGYRGQYRVEGNDRHPDVNKFPHEICDLNPVYIKVLDDKVIIEFFGGMNYCRLIAYSENFKEPDFGHITYGDKKLIDGLWLSSDLIDFKGD
jgi:hypothetical protein